MTKHTLSHCAGHHIGPKLPNLSLVPLYWLIGSLIIALLIGGAL